MIAEVFDRVAPRRGPVDVMSYISASRLNAWLKCPLAFKLQYIDGIRMTTTPSLFVGKVVHAALERYYRHRQLGLRLETSDLARRLIETWGAGVDAEDVRFTSVADEQLAQRQANELVAAYVQQLPHDEPKPIAVEFSAQAPLIDPFSGENLGIPLLGIMDLVVPEEVGPIITDFKTASKSSGPLEISHEIQLSCYAYLFRRVSPVEEAGLEIRSLVKTKQPQVLFHRYPRRTEQHFSRLFAVIRDYLDALHSGRFTFRPSWGCSSCEFRETHCRAWAG
jgi:putative RecB family exonuclease